MVKPSVKSDYRARVERKFYLYLNGPFDYELKKTNGRISKEGSINVPNSWYRNDVSNPMTFRKGEPEISRFNSSSLTARTGE